MVKKGQKNLNYSNILDAPCGKLPLYNKEVEFVQEVILVVSLLSTEVYFCTLNGSLTLGRCLCNECSNLWSQLGYCMVQITNCS